MYDTIGAMSAGMRLASGVGGGWPGTRRRPYAQSSATDRYWRTGNSTAVSVESQAIWASTLAANA